MFHRQRRRYAGLLGFLLVGMAPFACSSNGQSFGSLAGGKCTKSQDCASQLCVGGVCQGASDGGPGGVSSGGAFQAGSSCSQASDCQSGTCTGGLCMATVPLPNTTCSSGPDCASGICVSGKCQIPAGTSGTVDTTDCAAGSLGCSCQPGSKCKPGLTCTGGTCCNSKTGSCSPGSAQTGTGEGSGGSTPTACKPGFVGPIITECGYPFASANPLTDILFNESDVLAAIVPSGGYPFASIQLFYNDEHAMTLGVREAVINGASTSYPVSPLTKSPDVVNAPKTGTNLTLGPQAGVDPVGRPMWPALFITDITNQPNALGGDWQWGGTPVNPTYVAGTWKAAVRSVDASGAAITPDVDPAKNNQNYGNGHTAPAGAITKAEAYGAEVRWDIRLEPGHNYRFQVMVHDGDQNKVGGDAGEACVTFCAGNTCPEGLSACTTGADCTNGDICTGGCCIAPPPPPSPPASDAGTCPPNWKTYLLTEGMSICTPPPADGTCPVGYVLTIHDSEQFCTPVQLM